MAIEARIARGYAWRMIIIGVVCAVLGLWGVYDYAVDIPRRQVQQERLDLLGLCQAALETEQERDKLTAEARKAATAVESEIARVIGTGFDVLGTDAVSAMKLAQEEGSEVVLKVDQADVDWIDQLGVIRAGLLAERRIPLDEELYAEAYAAYEMTQGGIDTIGEVKAPGKHDRLIQWVYILCLPFAPYFFWLCYTANRQVYRLEDDGTLHTPDTTWKAHEISDVDMSRWMSKSIAFAVNHDGTRLKLDDYKFRNLFRIVGALASQFHSDEWDSEAKPINKEGETRQEVEPAAAE